MAQVSNQTELQQALALNDPLIEIIADFSISAQVTINYALLIRGTPAGVRRTLTRQTGYSGLMFSVASSGSLTLQTMTLSGDKENNPSTLSVISNAATLILDNSIIEQNSSTTNGGGIITSGTGRTCILVNDSAVRFCESQALGGGIYLGVSGTLQVQNASIHDNTAVSHGGGVFSDTSSIVFMENGNIYNNTSGGSGGGIYVMESGTISYTNGEISENEAALDGGGIYLADGGEAHILALASVYANTAGNVAPGIYNGGLLGLGGAVSIPNGVYIVSEENLIQVEAALDGAVVQLDESPYVFPARQRAPIDVAEVTEGYPLLSAADESAFLKPAPNFSSWFVERNEGNTRVRLSILPEYNIFYENLMGASNSNPGSYNGSTLPITLQLPGSLLGYRFVGWFDASEGGDQVTVIPVGTTGDITLYARWVATPPAPPTPPCQPCPPVSCCKPCHCCCPCCRDRK